MGKGKPAKKNTSAASANDPDELKVINELLSLSSPFESSAERIRSLLKK